MKTVVIKIHRKNPSKAELRKAALILQEGGIVVLPTDTVYGIAAGAFNLEGQRKIYRLKGRSFRKPLIIMAHNVASIEKFVSVNNDAKKLIASFWPGPLTIILPTTHLGKLAMGGRQDVGVRIPKDKTVQALISACGAPLATTSANVSGKPSAKSAKEAADYFKDKVDCIIDGGKSGIGRESTVIDMVKYPYIVVRHGCLSAKKILDCIS